MAKLTLFTNFINLTGSEFRNLFGREKTLEDIEYENDVILFNSVKLYSKEFLAVPHSYLSSKAEKVVKPVPFSSPLADRWAITDILLENLENRIEKRFVEDEIELPLSDIQIVNYYALDNVFSSPTIDRILDVLSIKKIDFQKLIK